VSGTLIMTARRYEVCEDDEVRQFFSRAARQGHNLMLFHRSAEARHGVRLKLFNMQAAAEAVKRFKAQSGRLLSLV